MVTKRDIPEDERYTRAVEKFERAKRRNRQDKDKGSRKAEARIKTLEAEVSDLNARLNAVTRLHRWVMKNVPIPEVLKMEYDKLRTAINQGDVSDVHPEA